MTEQNLTCLGIAGGWFPGSLRDCLRVEGKLDCAQVCQVKRKQLIHPLICYATPVCLSVCMYVFLSVRLCIYLAVCREVCMQLRRKVDRQIDTQIDKQIDIYVNREEKYHQNTFYFVIFLYLYFYPLSHLLSWPSLLSLSFPSSSASYLRSPSSGRRTASPWCDVAQLSVFNISQGLRKATSFIGDDEGSWGCGGGAQGLWSQV